MPKKQGMLPLQVGSGVWDQRRGGTVDAPEHNLERVSGSDSNEAEKLAEGVHHKPLSTRELKRQEEREDREEASED